MLEELKIIISAEISKLKEGMEDAKGAVDKFKDEVTKNKDDIVKGLTTVGEGAVAASKVIITSMAAAGAALLALAKSTEDYRQNQAQLNAAFEQAKLTTDSAAATYQHLYKVIGDDDQAVESAANIAMLASSEQDAAKWAELASGVLGTFHDTLQPEAFYEAANETLKMGEATGAFAQMLEKTGVMSVEEFNKRLAACNSEAEKQALLLNVSNQAMGAAGEAYDKATEGIQKQREAQAGLNQAMARLGEAASPVLTMLTQLATQILTALAPHIQNLATNYLPKLEAVLQGICAFLEPIAVFLIEHIEIVAGIAGLILGIAAAYKTCTIAITAYNAIKTIYTTITTLATAATAAFGTTAMATCGWILLIVAAIAAVIAIVYLLIDNWDELVAAMEEFGEKIKKAFNDMKDNVTNKVNEMKQNITNAFNNFKQGCVNICENLKNGIVQIFSNIRSSISSAVNNMRSSITSGFNSAKENCLDAFEKLRSGISGIMDKIRNALSTAVDKFKSMFNFNWKLPEIKLPHFSIVGEFSLNPPSIPSIEVDWYATGGVFDKPTLFGYGGGIGGLGENGAEAVVPLENNLGWLDKLATMLNARMSNNAPANIVLQVDGKTFAQTSINSINQLTKQTGSLQLVLA